MLRANRKMANTCVCVASVCGVRIYDYACLMVCLMLYARARHLQALICGAGEFQLALGCTRSINFLLAIFMWTLCLHIITFILLQMIYLRNIIYK